jgi:hypothetical protein
LIAIPSSEEMIEGVSNPVGFALVIRHSGAFVQQSQGCPIQRNAFRARNAIDLEHQTGIQASEGQLLQLKTFLRLYLAPHHMHHDDSSGEAAQMSHLSSGRRLATPAHRAAPRLRISLEEPAS